MSRRERRIVAALALANTIVIVALIVLIASPSGPDTAPSSIPAERTEHRGLDLPRTPQSKDLASAAVTQDACRWKAVQLMARAGLGGTASLTSEGSLRFKIIYPLAPDRAVDEAAQSAWAAFDIALTLEEERECASVTQIEITVVVQRDQGDTQITASTSATDLVAFGAGELSEAEFIERVTYTTVQPSRQRSAQRSSTGPAQGGVLRCPIQFEPLLPSHDSVF